MPKFAAVSFVSLGILMVVLVSGVPRASAAWLLDRSGTLVFVDGTVLGENETETEVEDITPETETHEVTQKQGEQARETAKQKLEHEIEARQKLQELSREAKKTTVQTVKRELNVDQEVKDAKGKVVRQEKNKLGIGEPLHIELEDGTELEASPAGEGDVLLKGEKVRTRTHFPITIGENNALIITKKDGTQKTVTYLPDAAVKNLEKKGFTTVDTETELEESDQGEPVYKFDVKKEKKIFGLFRSQFKEKASVSAESGEVVGTESAETSPFRRLLERFAL